MMPLVSVIIPTYNCEIYISQTLNSVLAQDYLNIEIIVVDDGSSDRTCEIVAQLSKEIRIITQSNTGVCAARNRGIQEANGQFICLLDHDDYWFPEKLSRQVQEFEMQPEVGAIYSSFSLWYPSLENSYPNPNTFDRTIIPDNLDREYSGWIYHLLLLDCWVLTSTAMFRAEVFKHCGVFDIDLPYSEDWDLWFRISRKYQFLKLRRPTTLYRQHQDQGNRRIRPIDYRTNLLSNAVKKWGRCSPDGQCLQLWKFRNQLAEYHASFGLHHLKPGSDSRIIAYKAFLKAWVAYPLKLKYFFYILANLVGWKPNW